MRSGPREKLEPGKRSHEFQADHGYRKWFKTQCELAGMKSINMEVLMGHSIGISDRYYRISKEDLLEDYLKAVNFLTISENNILRDQLTDLSEETNRVVEEKLHIRDNELEMQDKLKTDAIANLADQILKLQQEIENLKKRDVLESNHLSVVSSE